VNESARRTDPLTQKQECSREPKKHSLLEPLLERLRGRVGLSGEQHAEQSPSVDPKEAAQDASHFSAQTMQKPSPARLPMNLRDTPEYHIESSRGDIEWPLEPWRIPR